MFCIRGGSFSLMTVPLIPVSVCSEGGSFCPCPRTARTDCASGTKADLLADVTRARGSPPCV